MASENLIQAFENIEKDIRAITAPFFVPSIETGALTIRGDIYYPLHSFYDRLEKTKAVLPELTDSVLDDLINIFDLFLRTLRTFADFSDKKFEASKGDFIRGLDQQLEKFRPLWPPVAALYSEKLVSEALMTRDLDESLIKEQQNYYSQAIIHLQEQISKFNSERIRQEEELRSLKERSQEDAAQIHDLKNALDVQLDAFQARIAPILKTGELLKQQEIFIKTADENKRSSFVWGGMVLAFLMIISVVTYLFFKEGYEDFSHLLANKELSKNSEYQRTLFIYAIIKKSLAKIFILSLLVFILRVAIKNYNSLMHNYTVNMHKANSFAASLNLIQGVTDPVKSAEILNLAAKEIFMQQKTGYLVKDTSNVDMNLVEKVASLVKP